MFLLLRSLTLMYVHVDFITPIFSADILPTLLVKSSKCSSTTLLLYRHFFALDGVHNSIMYHT